MSGTPTRRCWGPGATGGPNAEIDHAAVHRLVGGDRTVATVVNERTAAVMILTKQGMTAGQIAARLGCSSRAVARHRLRHQRLVEARRLGRRLAVGGQFAGGPGLVAWDATGRRLTSVPAGRQYRWAAVNEFQKTRRAEEAR